MGSYGSVPNLYPFPGPPLLPRAFRVSVVKPHYILVQWITGYDGGFNQSFTIKYTDVDIGIVTKTPHIKDTAPSDGRVMQYNITKGVYPGVRYKLELTASNLKGTAISNQLLVDTPGL